jgi:hypothetical protein
MKVHVNRVARTWYLDSATVSYGDAVATILKLKSFAQSAHGLKTLKQLVDALFE